ncbi:hypothetical protein [Geodermatophilus sp. DSM 44513]|uniref:hypothetical protein n=1 Tax=Geodermatophilus sp. DSM 44513 TaxID=1528104 RepID=UPI00127E45A8|nr:hypothetical protein [Geodermatophilus sp. DSM 44513]WNV74768.1 hypothetical protein RTG05_17490 [Geodermatophilus sp. DSM 44513]
MQQRTAPIGVLVLGLTAGLAVGTATPAAAQGDPVGGSGNTYYLAGAGNRFGQAAEVFVYGDPGDEVYFGDFVDATGAVGGDGQDEPVVRRGNTFVIEGQGGTGFAYGDPGDTVLVGDWDGDGTDTLAVRRGNRYFVKNDLTTGRADSEFVYGDPGDTVLVGNWDSGSDSIDRPEPNVTDTLMVRRGNRFLVTNDTTPDVAEYEFVFGDPGDTVLAGDFAGPPSYGNDPDTPEWETDHRYPGYSGDGGDQLAVRRGNTYILSEEVWFGRTSYWKHLTVIDSFAYGDPDDTAFVAAADVTYDDGSTSQTLTGDGIAVRR